jgi:hypothetical protein
MLANGDVGVLLHTLSYRELHERPRHGVCDNAEVARWKRIATWSFEANVETDPQRHRPGSGEVLL